ncbi:hypothetical protein J0X19_19315 [Hymenobacter sp. BT186]|uniref:Uncharacterized protein n=1 Tax=Hymenobacter telluris TaxID=2816474 RepID=A0A939EYE5_9BACT|nr:hypothetical protein [Hymenobacter telluris]MBO0360119.1 hypothetical protein [Hymenobacter telluris]MBW3376146.1 hypothetical protein [Hymenobacter norwichensis]
MDDKEVNIKLTKDEALVLFEFLARFNESDNPTIFEDQAEQRVLWDIECILEKQLVEPFSPYYMDIIKEARNRIRDEE